MSVDPLAEKYAYNSTYAFQENKLGLGRELEGLELTYFPYETSASKNYIYGIRRKNNRITITRQQNIYGPTNKSGTTTTLTLGRRVAQNHITSYSATVIADNLMDSKNSSATITSGYRDPSNQARVMFNNIKSKGVASQKRLYKSAGDKVIDVYSNATLANKRFNQANKILGFKLLPNISENNIKLLMTNKIYEIGPGNVSKHSSNPNIYNVLDIRPKSIKNRSDFEKSIKSDSRFNKIITPPKDPAYHLEIPQL